VLGKRTTSLASVDVSSGRELRVGFVLGSRESDDLGGFMMMGLLDGGIVQH